MCATFSWWVEPSGEMDAGADRATIPAAGRGPGHPYRLNAAYPAAGACPDPAAGACPDANADQFAFVEASILDPATCQMSVYQRLVVDDGTPPALSPVVPTPDGDAHSSQLILREGWGINSTTRSRGRPRHAHVGGARLWFDLGGVLAIDPVCMLLI